MTFDPAEVETRLATYYDQEGDRRLRRPIHPRRVEGLEAFIAALGSDRPCRVLEIGSGPGRDATFFIDAGHHYVAVDRSLEHTRRCHAVSPAVAVASARRLPFRDDAFDALWTMSTLMHIPDSGIAAALAELSRVLRPKGVAAIGVWGGTDTEDEETPSGRPGDLPRLFSRRSDERWRSMLSDWFTIEDYQTWDDDMPDFFYQWAVVRA